MGSERGVKAEQMGVVAGERGERLREPDGNRLGLSYCELGGKGIQ